MSRSLRLRLSVGVLSVTVGVALLGGAASFALSCHHVLERMDDQLQRLCAVIDLQPALRQNFAPFTDSVSFVRLADPRAREPSILPRLGALHEGLSTVRLSGEDWRVFVHERQDGLRIVAGQKMSQRNFIARRSAAKAVAPFLLLMPLLVAAIHLAIGQAFKPLLELSREINESGLDRLHPISTELAPSEIHPFVRAIDGLLERVELAMARQRRFVADAAHEMRTPLTALSLRAQRLGMVQMPEPAQLEFSRLCEGIGRTQRLVEQLLALARTQDGPIDGPRVALEDVIRATVEELLPLSLERGIDLGIAEQRGQGPVGPEIQLRAVVRNLVENALRYAPQGGRVDISLVEVPEGTLLSVEDDGPGIPLEERERVFDPFHRRVGNEDAGSGLGLSIVRSVCERLGASIALRDAREGGLRADVLFPRERS